MDQFHIQFASIATWSYFPLPMRILLTRDADSNKNGTMYGYYSTSADGDGGWTCTDSELAPRCNMTNELKLVSKLGRGT